MDSGTIEKLLAAARQARRNAYAPYSRFSVGAAILTADGKVYTGCNVENVSYGAAICAERGAVSAAVAAGERDFKAICIAASREEILPCGICRQVLSEFSPDMEIYCAAEDGVTHYKLSELLPHSFSDFKPDEKNNHSEKP